MGWGARSNGRNGMPGNGNGPIGIAPGSGIGPSVPIIGQPFSIHGWFVTVVLQCKCGQREPVLVAGKIGAQGQCPACQRVFIIQAVASRPNGQLEFSIAMAVPKSRGGVEMEPAPDDPEGGQEPSDG